MFDEWVASADSGFTTVVDVPAQALDVVNDATVATPAINILLDNRGSVAGDLTAKDGTLDFAPLAVTNGTTFTIKAGSYTFASNTQFNPELNGKNFTGEVFLINDFGNRLSASTTVPEPSAAVLSLLGTGFLLGRRRVGA